MLNHYYSILREEAYANEAINWFNEIPQEKWTLAWDGGRWWGHTTTILVELINSILKKSRNMPINVLVKLTYLRCNALSNERGREVVTTLTSSQVYTHVLNNVIEDAQRKAKCSHCSWVWLIRHTVLGLGDNKPERGSAHWRFHCQARWKVVRLWQIPEIAHALFSCYSFL